MLKVYQFPIRSLNYSVATGFILQGCGVVLSILIVVSKGFHGKQHFYGDTSYPSGWLLPILLS